MLCTKPAMKATLPANTLSRLPSSCGGMTNEPCWRLRQQPRLTLLRQPMRSEPNSVTACKTHVTGQCNKASCIRSERKGEQGSYTDSQSCLACTCVTAGTCITPCDMRHTLIRYSLTAPLMWRHTCNRHLILKVICTRRGRFHIRDARPWHITHKRLLCCCRSMRLTALATMKSMGPGGFAATMSRHGATVRSAAASPIPVPGTLQSYTPYTLLPVVLTLFTTPLQSAAP